MSAHKFESLRSLIRDVLNVLDFVNVIERSFEIPLLQTKLFVSFYLFWKFFVCICTWSEEDKL